MKFCLTIDDIGNNDAASYWLGLGLSMGWVEAVESDKTLRLPDIDERMQHAFFCLEKEYVFKHKYDYVWIMQLIGEHKIKDISPFKTVPSYRSYLLNLGIKNVGGVSMLNQYYNTVSGDYPNWTFTDTDDSGERLRRILVAHRFCEVYYRSDQ